MTFDQFNASVQGLIKNLGESEVAQGYFQAHASRLHSCAEMFGLFSAALGDVLEIGPFYGCMPFILRPRASSYTVLEGDDPVVRRLDRVYQENEIKISYIDFAEVFGPLRTATHHLSFPDNSFDTILCWETMEHFNFNPVKLVREFHRVLKPGGRVCITVPNKASWLGLATLLTGRGEHNLIDSYYTFEDYEIDGKKAFHGYHWREYSPPELQRLFSRAGFKIQTTGSFTSFRSDHHLGLLRRSARAMLRVGAVIFPRYGTHIYLRASK